MWGRLSTCGGLFNPPRAEPIDDALHYLFTMAISQDLLDILVCPLCKEPVELKQDENGLKCPACKRVYPIRDDIPVMLVDEARIEE